MKKRHPLFLLLLATVGVTIIFMGIVWLSRRQATGSALSKPTGDSSLTETAITYSGWLEYFNSTLGLKLLYPPSFKNYQAGTLTSGIKNGSRGGSQLCINLAGCQAGIPSYFEIRSTSENWKDAKIQPVFLDLQGYTKDSDNYQAILISGDRVSLVADTAEEISLASGITALIVTGSQGDHSGLAYPQAGVMGAVINTNYPDYPAIVVQMQLSSALSRDHFILLIRSFGFPWYGNFPPDSRIQNDPTPPRFFDPDIRADMLQITKQLNCRYVLAGRYPDSYFPDQQCGRSEVITNGVNQKPYYYQPVNQGQGFILKAKLSTGEIYTLTEITNPPPTPTLPRGTRLPTPTPSVPN